MISKSGARTERAWPERRRRLERQSRRRDGIGPRIRAVL